jgi:uncharacterized membrane protein (DUF485 family)
LDTCGSSGPSKNDGNATRDIEIGVGVLVGVAVIFVAVFIYKRRHRGSYERLTG